MTWPLVVLAGLVLASGVLLYFVRMLDKRSAHQALTDELHRRLERLEVRNQPTISAAVPDKRFSFK